MFSDDEQTMPLSSLFHVLMTLLLNKCWRRSVLTWFLFSFSGCPLAFSCLVYSKNVLKLTVDNPCIILNTSMRLALIRRSSRDHSPSFFNLTSNVYLLSYSFVRWLAVYWYNNVTWTKLIVVRNWPSGRDKYLTLLQQEKASVEGNEYRIKSVFFRSLGYH